MSICAEHSVPQHGTAALSLFPTYLRFVIWGGETDVVWQYNSLITDIEHPLMPAPKELKSLKQATPATTCLLYKIKD